MSMRSCGAGVSMLFLAALPLLCACQYDPYTVSYARSKPEAAELVGHWVATDETLRDLAAGPYQQARPTIDVLGDGSIRINEVPDNWHGDPAKSAGKIETFVGTWQLEIQQDHWWGLTLHRKDWGCFGCLMVLGQNAPRELVLRFGDPDAGEGYEFRKGS